MVRVYLEMTLQMEDTSSSAMPMIRMASITSSQSFLSSVSSTWGCNYWCDERECFDISHVSRVEVIVVIKLSDPTVFSQAAARPRTHLIEDVEIPLSRVLADHSGLLQQEV